MRDPILAYWHATGLTPERFYVADEETGNIGETDQKTISREAALNRAHQIRQFEIELYWKRANYFWILQAAVFAAIGITWRIGGTSFPGVLPVALSALGALTASAGYFSAKGSKFWQENWEHHIDMLEDEFEGRLHKTAYVGKDGIRWSVSGVNDRLAVCFVIFWIGTLLVASIYANDVLKSEISRFITKDFAIMVATIISWIGLAIGVLALRGRKTNFKNAKGISFTEEISVYEGSDLMDGSNLPDIKALTKLKKPFLILREPKV